MPGGHDGWAETTVYFNPEDQLGFLRLDLASPNVPLEIKSITLRDVKTRAEFDAVLTQLDRSIQDQAKNVQPLLDRGGLYAWLGQYDQAAATLYAEPLGGTALGLHLRHCCNSYLT